MTFLNPGLKEGVGSGRRMALGDKGSGRLRPTPPGRPTLAFYSRGPWTRPTSPQASALPPVK